MSWNDEPRAAPEAGWYADPGGSGGLRYWDGASWTGHLTEPRSPGPATATATGPSYQAPPAPLPRSKTPVWVWIVVALVAVSVVAGGVVAVAVPAFRLARDAVWDDEAQLTLGTTQAAANQARDVSGGGFAAVTPEELDRVDPVPAHTAGPSTGPDVVSVDGRPDRLTLAIRSRSGTCWVVREESTGSQSRGRIRDGQPCVAATVEGFTVEEF